MPNKSPIFPIPQHLSDYGFDPRMGYSQVLEEAKKHKRETFPSISKEESKKKKKKHSSRWWKNALSFCKKKWVYQNDHHTADNHIKNRYRGGGGTMSGPIYITESRSGSSTPCRSTISGPLTLLIQPTKSNRAPYLNLREMNSDDQHPMPIYLVT